MLRSRQWPSSAGSEFHSLEWQSGISLETLHHQVYPVAAFNGRLCQGKDKLLRPTYFQAWEH